MIIGAMKCGTTSLYEYLKDHPALALPKIKEPEYFSQHWERGPYAAVFEPFTKDHVYALDASTGYTKFPMREGVPQRIYEYGLRPKFIYLVRDPFQRIESHHNFISRYDYWNETIEAEALLHISNYYQQLEQYRAYFPKEDIRILDFAELQQDPQAVVNKVIQFLGLEPWAPATAFNVHNKTEIDAQVERSLRSKWGGVLPYLPESVKKLGKQLLKKGKPITKERLTTAQRSKIKQVLADDMKRFEEEYGFDVSAWGF
jgi:hypothetical protein